MERGSEIEKVDPKIINISSRNFQEHEIKLLKRGLKFCPTPSNNIPELQKDVQEFDRKLRLLDFFDGVDENDVSLVRNKSNFVPPKSKDEHLELYLKTISTCRKQKVNVKKSNISYREQKALQNLMNDDTIIIKEADKGGAIVIMDKEFYRQKILELLNDPENYQKISANKDKKVLKLITNLTRKYADELTNKELDYLTQFNYKTSNFYGLPKIHKSELLNEAIKKQNKEYIEITAPQDLKMRPIVAGPSSPTHRLSNFIDLILKPLCKKVPSFLRDSVDFLNHLPENTKEESILTSFDVVSLYTSIPHDLGREAISFWLKNYDIPGRKFSDSFVLEAIDIILKENTFQFDGENYQQIQGTAMGTKMAPTYATLVMGYLEHKLYKSYETRYPNEKTLGKNFKRFLDDCFIIWEKSENELAQFHQELNTLHPKIQFTMEMSRDRLPFLDILVYKQGEKIETDIFYKQTDTHQYLNFHSCHPKHTKKGVPFNLARRICTIVSDATLRNKRLEELQNFLVKQRYPIELIKNGISRAKDITVTELRNIKDRSTENVIPLVITQNPNNPSVTETIRGNMNILNGSEKMRNILSQNKFIISYRQPKNLKKQLTSAAFNSNKQQPEVTACGEKRCGTCKHILTGDTFRFKNGKTWTVKSNMDCKSKYVIYVLICEKCKSFYVGQTEDLRKRVTLHREQIKHEKYRHLPVSHHMANCNDGDFKIIPIYLFFNTNRKQLEQKEKEIIEILKPELNVIS